MRQRLIPKRFLPKHLQIVKKLKLSQPTFEYLNSLPIHLKKSVRAVAVYYRTGEISSKGVRSFVKKNVPQLQFKNPAVQFVMFKNLKEIPTIRIFCEDGNHLMLDAESKNSLKIIEEIKRIAAKPDTQVAREQQEVLPNPANFGDRRAGQRLCICEVPGQVPCPKYVPMLNVKHEWKEKKETAV